MGMTNRLACAAALTLAIVVPARADVLLAEGFNDISTLAGSGWAMVNNSSPAGSTAWFQGDTLLVPAASGGGNSYIAANFDNAGFGGAISNWLITPTLAMGNGTQLDFMVRLLGEQGLTDTVQVYLSTNGSSADVGSTASSTGDFLQLLATYSASDDAGSWLAESITLSGLAGDFNGRLAFRYVVSDTSLFGDYVGIDSVQVSSAAAALPEPGSLALVGLALVAATFVRRRRAT